MPNITIKISGLKVFEGKLLADDVGQGGWNPVSVPLDSWHVVAGDGQVPAVHLHDSNADRDAIPETNETQPFAIFADYDHAPSGKEIVHLEQRPEWVAWLIDLLGQHNFDQLRTPADGYMDTGSPEGDNYPLMCSAQGGSLLNIVETYTKSGTRFDFCETLDFDKPPQLVDGVWLYEGKALSWLAYPHLFASRVNKAGTKRITWATRNGNTSKSDARKGDEHWPYIARRRVTQPRADLRLYPTLPATLRLHDKSVIVEGDLDFGTNSREIVVDEYRFRGSSTYVREKDTGLWFLADEMLARADLGYPGNIFDYRCYVSVKEVEPWMGPWGYRVPVCGWVWSDLPKSLQ